jgi:hypothetical protein
MVFWVNFGNIRINIIPKQYNSHITPFAMLTIKLLGMGRQIEDLLQCLGDARINDPRPIQLEIIDKVTVILNHDVEAIPAMIIGNTILGEGKIPATEEVRSAIFQYYENNQLPPKIAKMKGILRQGYRKSD